MNTREQERQRLAELLGKYADPDYYTQDRVTGGRSSTLNGDTYGTPRASGGPRKGAE